jgi:hypothetical protein
MGIYSKEYQKKKINKNVHEMELFYYFFAGKDILLYSSLRSTIFYNLVCLIP